MGRPANDSVNCSINNIYQLEGRVREYPKVCVNLQTDVR